MNDNGLRFHKFFNNLCLSVLNTWFWYSKCGRITWHWPDHVTKNVYHFILAFSWLHQHVSNHRIYNSNDFDSYHRLVIADICTPCTKVVRYMRRAACVNFNCLKQSDTTLEKLENFDLNSTNSVMNNRIISYINSTTEETLPMRAKTRLYQLWHDDIILKEL